MMENPNHFINKLLPLHLKLFLRHLQRAQVLHSYSDCINKLQEEFPLHGQPLELLFVSLRRWDVNHPFLDFTDIDHRNVSHWGLSSFHQEFRRRIWANIYILDAYQSVVYGRPPIIQDAECDVVRPSPRRVLTVGPAIHVYR